jgi:PAS domain S-box-containing protein
MVKIDGKKDAIKEEASYRIAIEQSIENIFFVDLKTKKIIKANKTLCDLLGYTQKDMCSLTIYDLVAHSDKDIKDKINAITKDKRVFLGERKYKRKDNFLVDMEVSASLINFGDRKVVFVVSRDISQRKQVEAHLRESQERYQNIVEKTNDMIYEMDKRGRFTFFNSVAIKNLEYSKEELEGKLYLDLVRSDYLLDVQDFYRSQRLYKIPNTYRELPIKTKTQREMWIGQNVHLIMKKDQVVGFQAVARDITMRKQAEEALKNSEKKYRSLIDNLKNPLTVFDLKGTILLINKAGAKNLGTTPEQVMGRSLYDFFPVMATTFLERARKVKKTGKWREFEDEIKLPSGNRWFYSINQPLRDANNKIFALQIISYEITERKQTEKALKESEKKFKAQFKSMPIPTYIWQKTGKDFTLTDYNQAAFEITRGNIKNFIGIKVNKLYKERQDILHDFHLCFSRKTTIKRDMEYLFKFSGETKYFSVNYAFVPPDLVMVHTEDISQRKKMEQELLKSEKLESLGFLAGGIAHDFNNILAAVMGYISLAKFQVDQKDQVILKLNEAEKAISRAKDLTMQLLTFSKGGAPMKIPASITELVRDTMDFSLSGSKVKCKYQVQGRPWNIEIDEGQISQVIQNLIINAEQAMPSGGTIEITIKNTKITEKYELPLKEGKFVLISIRDEGTGIPQDHIDKVFDPFFTTKQKGSGLGLSTAYSIVKNHNGLITVDSELGKGTTFYIYLPATTKRLAKNREENKKILVGHGKILLMDDETMILKSISELLQQMGYTVETAKNGTEAINLYIDAQRVHQSFDLVILDLIIPGGMSGAQTVKELKRIDPKVKVVVSSGYSTDPVMANFRKYGFVGALSKPFKPKELSSLLHELIPSSRK